MKILIVTDTWHNINGVVTTLRATKQELETRGHQVHVIEPSQFRSMACPGYPEVRLSWNLFKMGHLFKQFDPDCVHIATEGPLGLAARLYCKFKRKPIPYNTSYHTRFPEYLHMHHGIPVSWGYFWMRVFHKYSSRVLVTTALMKNILEQQGFERLVVWNRGVDIAQFNPHVPQLPPMRSPVLLCVSRVSVEKGLDDFCALETEGTKILVGDGPYLPQLKLKYPDVQFVGYKQGTELAQYYASAHVFVFPSRTDTFGVVMLEAMACGTPVAAYPVPGPLDVIEPGVSGVMCEDLHEAVRQCEHLNRHKVAQASERFDWHTCTDVFESQLVRITG